MMPEAVAYLRLEPGAALPDIGTNPKRILVVVDGEVSLEWKNNVSDWLVRSGCRYMLAWGTDCSSWDDAVDWAALEVRDGSGEIDENFVMTTWHDGWSLEDVVRFCKVDARHPIVDLEFTLILEISRNDRGTRLLEIYAAVEPTS